MTRMEQLRKMPAGKQKRELAEAIYQDTVASWDNIFRLEGRRLREFMGIPEKHDIQAAFPFLDERCIVRVDDVRKGDDK